MRPDELATDVGSIIDGDEAVKCGIINAVGGLSDALEALREMITENKKAEKTRISSFLLLAIGCLFYLKIKIILISDMSLQLFH